MDRKLTLWQKLKAYKLQNNVYAILMLLVSVILSSAVYISPLKEIKFVPELALACATSLLATIFGLISDVFVKFKTYQNDKLMEGIHEFGINNLHFDKQKLLEDLLQTCHREVWISGYRLILTSRLAPSLANAVKQGATIKILVSPPWKSGFQLVYGDNHRVIDNYCQVFNAIAKASKEIGRSVEQICEVRFISKPLFSDTYKVDMNLITGPYMHNRDDDHHRITANDFFTYNLMRTSKLYNLVENEYLTLWDEAEETLQWDRYFKAVEQIHYSDLREKEKMELISNACQPYKAISA
ncbi:hypothetical protein [Paenibacillus sp. An7]|uniref:hypothetical protein n=1 Tax=Paenibacillus sp. An7 TaxID=2689577 RepID=UPI001359F394|nr:hypothetical protein [Paenibacillus sp. An7]